MKPLRQGEIRQLLSGGDRRSIADSNRVRLLVEDDPSLVGELIALTGIDIDHQLLPDNMTLPLLWLGLLLSLAQQIASIGLPVDPWARADRLPLGAAQRAEIVAELHRGERPRIDVVGEAVTVRIGAVLIEQ